MNIKNIYQKYINQFPEEANDLELLAKQADDESADLISRKNFVGHAVASGFIVHLPTKRLLLLGHKGLGAFLQPGGHIESEDGSLKQAVFREVEEETGLKPEDLKLLPLLESDPEVPFDIDTHYIPANDKKAEPEHYHHDCRLLFVTEKSDIEIDPNETNGFKWVDLDEQAKQDGFGKVCEKIKQMID